MHLNSISISLYIGLSTLVLELGSAQTTDTPGGLIPPCTTAQIEKGGVTNCACVAGKDKGEQPGDKCNKCDIGLCNKTPQQSVSRLSACYQGCTDANHPCNSCFIWFKSVCECQQNGNCASFLSAKGDSTWIKIAHDRLITTTTHTPGILELHSEAPWQFGQSGLVRDSKALTINSVSTRTQEQIHIHDCPVLDDPKKLLAKQNYADFDNIAPIKHMPGPDPWQCKVNSNKGQDIDRVTTDLQNFIAKHPDCTHNIGAAVVVDSNDRTWMCITTDADPTQYTFCSKDPKSLGVEEGDAIG
ncbi:uncharacterized protein N7511_009228 [Penicillium nucicola]|uniref:uncharacterized protein n=1 Tax=Penicillium nucicola TaxID=1850975 RepID=UPI0025457E56|nr:uncharacterized protein N7511_009228 [Penicillium nucicola]KAJ5747532.1 hypothetical protein N7511_009228 [Penicillium nucicola]